MGWNGKIYEFSGIDLWTWLFNKRPCPKCGGKLKRKSSKKYLRTGMVTRIGYGDEYRLTRFLKCESCGQVWTEKMLEEKWYKK